MSECCASGSCLDVADAILASDWFAAEIAKAQAEQREKDAVIAESYFGGWALVGYPEFDLDRVMNESKAKSADNIAAAIREGENSGSKSNTPKVLDRLPMPVF